MPLVAGIDSSTQSCKVVIRDSATGALVRQGRASHPDGTEVHPDHWWTALQEAIAAAGGLDDVDAVSVGGQQHGMVCLDETGEVVRPALLWNDTRSARDAEELILDAGQGDPAAGSAYWASSTGTVPVASLTATKLRWLARNEPENARRTAAVCLPHDWLSWRLAGHGPGTGQESWNSCAPIAPMHRAPGITPQPTAGIFRRSWRAPWGICQSCQGWSARWRRPARPRPAP